MIVLVGKTASGKTLIANEMMKRGYKKIVTTTTRPMRKKEFDGIDYDFISEDEFIEKAKNHYFLEFTSYKTINGTWYYGTPLESVENAKDKSVVILSPYGCKEALSLLSDENITIFYIYANNNTIKSRLMKRGDNKDEAERRIKADNADFKGIELLADRIIYNNGNRKIEDVVDEIILYVNKKKK